MGMYDKSAGKWSQEEFEHPGAEYREAPFWAWNCRLELDELKRQLDVFKEMGMGGFFPHSRSGMATRYLSDEFFGLVKECAEYGKKNGLLCYLYDEDRWPSGAAGGLVTKEIRYRARHMVISPDRLEGYEAGREPFEKLESEYQPDDRGNTAKPKGYFICCFRVWLKEGYLERYEIMRDIQDGEGIWYVYLQLEEESPWYNGQTYLDTLNKSAVERFVELTYEGYYWHMGEMFGDGIPAVFTDEPQFTKKDSLMDHDSRTPVNFPYTNDFDDTFAARYGYHIEDRLPELIWNRENGKLSQARYHYHDHVCERFVEAFSDTIGAWCQRHGIVFTGHVFWEDNLYLQTRAVGETMRFYRSFQIPGVDMLRDDHFFVTLKQCQSVARQKGSAGIMSELYGVTNWHFDFKGYKIQGDWQAALGVTFRVPHLSLVSMEGEAKRDFPSSFNYQAPWKEEYPLIADHFARVNTAMTRGKPDVRVGVVHPIESYWVNWGVNTQLDGIRSQQDKHFQDMAEWLLFGLVDFDYISESLLSDEPEDCADDKVMHVGKMGYEAVIVPDCITLRRTTLERLERFRKRGGNVIFMGHIPEYIDALESGEAKALAEICTCIPFEKHALLEAVEEYRFLDATLLARELPDDYRTFYRDILSGARINNLIYQMRTDGDNRWIFLAHAYNSNQDTEWPDETEFSVKGFWRITLYDTLTGGKKETAVIYRDGRTWFYEDVYKQDSFLWLLEPAEMPAEGSIQRYHDGPGEREEYGVQRLDVPDDVRFEEPNVYLMDYAEWEIDSEGWQSQDNILRVDTKIREKLGWPVRSHKNVEQPWVRESEQEEEYPLKLRYMIYSEIECEGMLALERPQDLELYFNGEKKECAPEGYFVDKSIPVLKGFRVRRGENTIEVRLRYSRLTNLESMYFLGDFGVAVHGDRAALTRREREIRIGDIVLQGYPFYGGNLDYVFRFTAEEKGQAQIFIPRYEGHLTAVWLDGEKLGPVAFAPHKKSLGCLEKGEHELRIRVYGNRFNTFGQLHLPDIRWTYWGPDSWRSHGSNWLTSYHFRPAGLVTSPELLWKKEE